MVRFRLPGAGAGARPRSPRGARLATPAAVAALALTAGWLAHDAFREPSSPALPPLSTAAVADQPAGVPIRVDLRRGLPFSMPRLLTIPGIGVRAPIVPTGQLADGTPAVPPMSHPEQVGWYMSSVTPGERGASVLWGHLDTRTGTAVFIYLRSMRVGMRAQVVRSDGKVATFVVERTASFRRDAFPGHEVYDDPGYPALRLVTCGGSFDRKRQEYSDNFVVFARLESVTAPLATAP